MRGLEPDLISDFPGVRVVGSSGSHEFSGGVMGCKSFLLGFVEFGQSFLKGSVTFGLGRDKHRLRGLSRVSCEHIGRVLV